MKIVIIYYIFINELNDWRSIVLGQLGDISSIPSEKVYCIVCAKNMDLINEVSGILPKNYEMEYELSNNFEYPGFKKLYTLATEYPDKIFLYMHTKGMFFHENKGRLPAEMVILQNTVMWWKYILFIFEKYKNIDKAGLFPGHSGIMWCNFFWVRGSFFKNLNEPEISPDRYYYEHYIASDNKDDCFNLLRFDTSRVHQRDVNIANIQKFKRVRYKNLAKFSK